MATWIEDSNGNKCSVEYWAAIPGYFGAYEISTSGNIRSCNRINVNRQGVARTLQGKALTPSIDSEGYLAVSLFQCGKEKKARVHRLVAQVFVKNPHGKPLVDHKNRIRTDCNVRNIRWATPIENRNNSAQNPSITLDDMRILAEEEAKAGAA